jgi:hypothetical protein
VPDLLCLAVEDDGKQHGKDEKERHAPEKDLWARKLDLIGCRCCHPKSRGESKQAKA